ncbi:MAG: hypothetical protein ABSD20_10220 [Terriglobales bacterium]|jgi:photosystem II stability/assembly factor-like uncharacterized protein
MFMLLSASALAQWQPLESLTTESLRGLSVVNKQIVWAGGTHGTYLFSTDGGTIWLVRHIPDAEALDFRGVKSFGAETYLLASGEGEKSRIYHTVNMGDHWDLQYVNQEPKGFLDCMAFFDRKHGIVVGDPVKGKFQILRTSNGGATWQYSDPKNMPPAVDGEGAFAASNTCLATQGGKNAWFVTGGSAARIFRSTDGGKSWKVTEAPREMPHGDPTAGIFSVAFIDARHGVIAGGDYKHPEAGVANLSTSDDGGATWKLVKNEEQQYFSAIAFVSRPACQVTVGPSVSAFSIDGLQNWGWFSPTGFNAVGVNRGIAFAVGPKGSIGKAEVECALGASGRR